MKVIDLLNRIANGEDFKEKHFKYIDRIDQEIDICMISEENIIYKLDEKSIKLNDEVEIIEEDKKIEKLFTGGYDTISDTTLANKINEIIDEINKLKEVK